MFCYLLIIWCFFYRGDAFVLGPWCPFKFSNHFAEVERASWLLYLVVLLLLCDCTCHVSIPRGTMHWYVAYDCGISGSCLPAFL